MTNAAVVLLSNLLRQSSQLSERIFLCEWIVERLAQAESVRLRQRFLRVCHRIIADFSTSFFKEHFWDATLALAEVRL